MKKIIGRIVGIFICIVVVASCLFLIISALKEYKNNNKVDEYKSQAINNVQEYIKEKYHDKKLEVTGVKIDGLYVGYQQSDWNKIAKVTLKDNNGYEYTCETDVMLDGEKGIKSCRDNVQEKEIKTAIINKVEEDLGIYKQIDLSTNKFNSIENIIEHIEFRSAYSGNLFHEKFDGNIISFLNTHKNINNETPKINVWIAYTKTDIDITSASNAEILNLLDFVALIEFKDRIPENDFLYKKLTPEGINISLNDAKISYNNLHTYSKSAKRFIEYEFGEILV